MTANKETVGKRFMFIAINKIILTVLGELQALH